MPDDSILSDSFIRELISVGEVDIVVGLPTHNDARTVGAVVQAIRAGLLRYFPRARSVIINADGGSRDDTQELIRAAAISDFTANADASLRTLHSISTEYPGGAADGSALHTILAAADLLRAKVCAVISPDSTTIEPEWIERLLRPILNGGRDMVLPVYRRNKLDGLLIRNLIYPMTRSVFRCAVREPYASEFALSGELGSQFLAQDIWTQEPGRHGAELWLAISAVASRLKLTQSFLGTKARSQAAPADLVKAMVESVGALFRSMEALESAWTPPREPLEAPCNNCQCSVSLEPLRLNRKRLYQMFTFGLSELEPVLVSILSIETHAELKRLARLPEERFAYSGELWARTVYEFASAHKRAVIGRDHIVQALVPLFRGRAVTFVNENRDVSAEQVESNIESLCQTFEHEMPYLLKLWSGGK